MNEKNNRLILFDGAWKSAGEPLISAESRAVWYGDGCFETFRTYSGRFLKLESHIERLFGGMEYLGIAPPPGLQELKSGEPIRRMLEENHLGDTDAVVRIQVWREGKRGFTVSDNHESHYAVSALPLPEIPETVRLAIVSTPRIPTRALDSSFKLSNSINYIKASSEAVKKNADDALMLTVDGFISETTVSNIFWYCDGKIRTPSPDCDILPGITRSIVMPLLKEKLDQQVVEGRYTPEEMMKAEVVWICNSVRELVPVESVEGHTFTTDHPLFIEMASLFETYKEKALK